MFSPETNSDTGLTYLCYETSEMQNGACFCSNGNSISFLYCPGMIFATIGECFDHARSPAIMEEVFRISGSTNVYKDICIMVVGVAATYVTHLTELCLLCSAYDAQCEESHQSHCFKTPNSTEHHKFKWVLYKRNEKQLSCAQCQQCSTKHFFDSKVDSSNLVFDTVEKCLFNFRETSASHFIYQNTKQSEYFLLYEVFQELENGCYNAVTI